MQTRMNDEMDRLFIEFSRDRNSTTPRPLLEWIAANPDMKEEFVAWSTDFASMEFAEKQPADPAAEAHALQVGLGVLKKLGFAIEEPSPFSSLNDAARQGGYSPRQLAQKLGLGMSLFAKLNRRLLNVATIPQRLIERLAEELQTTAEQTRAYLSQPPTLAAGALYRSEQAPETVDQQDFADAVRTCSDMSETEKAEWLA